MSYSNEGEDLTFSSSFRRKSSQVPVGYHRVLGPLDFSRRYHQLKQRVKLRCAVKIARWWRKVLTGLRLSRHSARLRTLVLMNARATVIQRWWRAITSKAAKLSRTATISLNATKSSAATPDPVMASPLRSSGNGIPTVRDLEVIVENSTKQICKAEQEAVTNARRGLLLEVWRAQSLDVRENRNRSSSAAPSIAHSTTLDRSNADRSKATRRNVLPDISHLKRNELKSRSYRNRLNPQKPDVLQGRYRSVQNFEPDFQIVDAKLWTRPPTSCSPTRYTAVEQSSSLPSPIAPRTRGTMRSVTPAESFHRSTFTPTMTMGSRKAQSKGQWNSDSHVVQPWWYAPPAEMSKFKKLPI
jgi:hypothetical protein